MLPWRFLTLFGFAILFGMILSNPAYHKIHKRRAAYFLCQSEKCQIGESICYDNTTNTFSCLCSHDVIEGSCRDAQSVGEDECVDQPCQNGGSICHYDLGQKYSCNCAPGFTGDNCQYRILEIDVDSTCAQEPCQNGGTICHGDTTNTYSCTCPLGFTGNHCEIPLP